LHLLLSSLTFIIAKFVLAHMPVATLALLRFLIASGSLAAIWLARGGRPEEFEPRDWRRLAFLGLLAVPLNQGFFLWGLQNSSPAHAALFYSTTPLFVLGISVMRGEERLRPARLAGLVLALLGVLLILLGRGLRMDPRFVFGDFLLLLAVACWALYSVNGRALMKEHDPFTVTAMSLILGTTLSLPAVPWAFHGFHPAAYSAGVWGGVLFLALGTSVLAYFLWIWCLSKSEASRVAVFTNFQPVVTTVLAFLIFREKFTAEFFVGGAMVLAGVFVVQRF
jgi:drug/metabolite transporter (DMT)-like permease